MFGCWAPKPSLLFSPYYTHRCPTTRNPRPSTSRSAQNQEPCYHTFGHGRLPITLATPAYVCRYGWPGGYDHFKRDISLIRYLSRPAPPRSSTPVPPFRDDFYDMVPVDDVPMDNQDIEMAGSAADLPAAAAHDVSTANVPATAAGATTLALSSGSSPVAPPTSFPPASTFPYNAKITVTPRPPNGFPMPSSVSLDDVLRNVAPESRVPWLANRTPCIFAVQAAPNSFRPETAGKTARLIQNVINGFLGTNDVFVSPPIQLEPNVLGPYCYLVQNLTEEQRRVLLEQGCLSTNDISILLFSTSVTTDLVTTIVGWNVPDGPTGKGLVLNCVLGELTTGPSAPSIRNFIVNNHDAFPELSADAAVEKVLSSVHVEHKIVLSHNKPDDEQSVWFVYATSPTIKAFNEWCDLFVGMAFIHPDFGKGIAQARDKIRCSLCQDHTHTRPMCSFPKVPGWLGPKNDVVIPTSKFPSSSRFVRGGSAARGRAHRGSYSSSRW